ncbi:hypothetical protein TNCV_3422151 [Trichonephila clavipes]|nr:hypothetical protein TNCV_3422151 [Trichonephila clavipes]
MAFVKRITDINFCVRLGKSATETCAVFKSAIHQCKRKLLSDIVLSEKASKASARAVRRPSAPLRTSNRFLRGYLTSYGTVGRNFRYALPVTVSDECILLKDQETFFALEKPCFLRRRTNMSISEQNVCAYRAQSYDRDETILYAEEKECISSRIT